ncbi:hypothetical protein HYR99_07980 [Candidatus Poribacteria bacterium]|nr:hypothetical protein [Candidatus Poribacteria bacterium]
MNIREPTIQQYVYFLRFNDTLEGMRERDSEIGKQIEALRKWIERLSGQAITGPIASPPRSRSVSRELFRTEGWLEQEGGQKAYSFTVRAYSDTTIVQVAYTRNGEGEGLNDFREMRHELWDGSRSEKFQSASYFLGQTLVLCAVTEQADETTAQAILNAWVDPSNELCRWGLTPSGTVSAGCGFDNPSTGRRLSERSSRRRLNPADIGVGTLYFDTAEPTTLILLYPQQAEEAAGAFLNDQLPFIELHRQKCAAQVHVYEHVCRPAIEGLEKELRAELDATEEPTTKFRELQRRAIDLSRLQQRYKEALGELEKIQTTVEINLQNLKNLTSGVFKPDACLPLYKEGLDQYQRSVEQVGYDRRYFEVADQQATVARETLQTLVEVARGQVENFITYLLFGLGTVIALNQVIDPDAQVTRTRLLIAGIGLVLLGVFMVCYYFYQDRVLQWFLGRTKRSARNRNKRQKKV